MGFLLGQEVVVRYRGFLLLEQTNKGWLVRPERSPMRLLPFRTPSCSLADVKTLLDCSIGGCRKTAPKSTPLKFKQPLAVALDFQSVAEE
jgi:hypothetical protein